MSSVSKLVSAVVSGAVKLTEAAVWSRPDIPEAVAALKVTELVANSPLILHFGLVDISVLLPVKINLALVIVAPCGISTFENRSPVSCTVLAPGAV